MFPSLPSVSLPINLTPPPSLLGALSAFSSALPPLPGTPPQAIQLFMQLLGALPPYPLPH